MKKRPVMALRFKTAAVLIALLVIYSWMPGQGWRSFNLQGYHTDQYNLLTDGFLSGHTYLEEEIPPGLLALADPYDPNTNGKYRYEARLWDQSLYKGKCYLYFGVSPVVSLYLPYRVLTRGLRLPNAIAVLIYSYGALLFATGLLYSFRRRYFPSVPDWMLLSGVVLVGAGDLACYLLSQSNIYQVAIACGMFFSLGALYFLSRAFELTSWRLLWLVLSGIWLAFAIGGRPHFALSCGLIFLIAMLTLWRRGERRLSRFAALALSSGTGVFLLGLYNWLRFGSFVDFGLHYQLSIINMNKPSSFGIQRVPSTLYFMFLQPPTLNGTFPYVHPNPALPSWLARPEGFLLERIAGILVGTPFLWMIAIALVVAWRHRHAKLQLFPRLELAWICCSLVLLVSVLSLTLPTMRYLADFAALLDISAVLAWFYLDQRLAPRGRFLSRALGMALLVLSAMIGILFALPAPFHFLDG